MTAEKAAGMSSSELRAAFLEFFRARGHAIDAVRAGKVNNGTRTMRHR